MTTKMLFRIEIYIKGIEALHKLTTLILMLGIKKIISSYISINMGNSISCISTTVFVSVYYCYFHF